MDSYVYVGVSSIFIIVGLLGLYFFAVEEALTLLRERKVRKTLKEVEPVRVETEQALGAEDANKISIKGLNRADVLAILFNRARAQGLGFLHYDPKPMTREIAEKLLHQTTYFDYVQGRVMKVDLSSDAQFDPWLYDRDNGQGAAAEVIEVLRKTGETNPVSIQTAHHENTVTAIFENTDLNRMIYESSNRRKDQ